MIHRHAWGGLADPAESGPADIAILGVPYDGAVCLRAGAAEAPTRLRAFSRSSPAIAEDGVVIDPSHFRVRDLGDVAAPRDAKGESDDSEAARTPYFERVQAAAHRAMAPEDGRRPFLLSIGGDHSVTIPLFRAFADTHPGDLGLILLDAHPDLFDVYEGSATSHACPMRRVIETGRVKPEHMLILGTRSYNEVELSFMRAHKIRFVPCRELSRMGAAFAVEMARQRFHGIDSVYLTLDIDVADPSCAPGTGAPVAGGLSSRELLDLTRGLVETVHVRAMDIVEVAPPLDPTEATLALALQLVFETFAVVAAKTS